MTASGATSTVVGLGASKILDGTETTLADANADVIEDFDSTEGDTISFDGLGAGAAGNYAEGGPATDFGTALSDATTAMGTGATYFLTSTAADGGLLFFDANGNGEADGVVSLVGIDASNFDFNNIVA